MEDPALYAQKLRSAANLIEDEHEDDPLVAWLRAAADDVLRIPVGWRLVPEEPTPAMAEAFAGELDGACGSFFDWDRGGDEAYRAMLAAAPIAGGPAPPVTDAVQRG